MQPLATAAPAPPSCAQNRLGISAWCTTILRSAPWRACTTTPPPVLAPAASTLQPWPAPSPRQWHWTLCPALAVYITLAAPPAGPGMLQQQLPGRPPPAGGLGGSSGRGQLRLSQTSSSHIARPQHSRHSSSFSRVGPHNYPPDGCSTPRCVAPGQHRRRWRARGGSQALLSSRQRASGALGLQWAAHRHCWPGHGPQASAG